jgi:hypothetical protein
MKKFISLSLAIFLLGISSVRAKQADVVVYGSTPGGFCAAIAAAREGASVILLEPTEHVGGVNTGGLSHSDSNQTIRNTVMGLFDEWHTRIEKDYASRGVKLPYRVNVKDDAKWTYEPHVAARVTRQMLDEANVDVLTKRVLQSVTKTGTRVIALVTSNGTFTAKVFIDATYEGDLMAAAGVGWTIGREGPSEFGESLAGKRYPKPIMKIDGFTEDGKTLPLITTTDAGPDEKGDTNVMVYSFRLCLTANPGNRVPFPKPVNYHPARFEVIRRYAKSGGTRLGFDLYPLPGGKFDGNNSIGGQFSLGLVGACNGWCEADAVGRAAIWEAHKQYTLELYQFLTTDPAVPAGIRRKFSMLGLCRDEFPNYGHFSPALYVREGRRMKGMYVLSQKDILGKQNKKEDPIVISSFPIDSHDCQRVALEVGGVINEGTIFPVRMKGRTHGYPYHIPYRAILPKPNECSNLLVPVALSCTHVAISSIRVEPTWMIIGQSAGIAAALAAKKDVAVQKLQYSQLRERLLVQKQVLDLPLLSDLPPTAKRNAAVDPATLAGIVLDDAAAEQKGAWKRSINFKPFIGTGYVHDNNTNKGMMSLIFKTNVPRAGRYDIRLAYSPHESRASNLPMTISVGGKDQLISINQQLALDADSAFRTVATVDLKMECEMTLTISNKGTDGFVVIDAVQILENTKAR